MNCTNHPDITTEQTCPVCSKPFCERCFVRMGDRQICTSCCAMNPAGRSAARPAAPPLLGTTEALCSPPTAFALGMIPGVGAICNGEYLKAFVHVLTFGFLISLTGNSRVGSFHPLFVIMMIAFYWYMPVEAYHTAKRRAFLGSGLKVYGQGGSKGAESLWTGVILILIGSLLFVNELLSGFLESALRFWPLVLVAFGIHKVWEHFNKVRPLEAVKE